MDWLSKVRNTNHVCLLSPWKKFSALFRVYSEVSTCLSVVTEWHLFNNSKKYGENGEILFFIWFDSYIIWSLQDDFFVIFGGGGFGLFFFFVWVGFFLTMLFDWNTVKRNDPVLLSLLVLAESRLVVADKPSLLCLPSAWAERADCKPACVWKLPSCVQAI